MPPPDISHQLRTASGTRYDADFAHFHSSLAKAGNTLAEARFDLLIPDVNLPDGSGLDLLRQVRSKGDTTPAILLTANDLEPDEITGLVAGADDNMTKPFSLAVLQVKDCAAAISALVEKLQTLIIRGKHRSDMDF